MSHDRRVSGVRRGVLTRKILPYRPGYTVRVLDAIAVLERHSPAAAQWWREHTPYLIRPGKLFVFALELFKENGSGQEPRRANHHQGVEVRGAGKVSDSEAIPRKAGGRCAGQKYRH
jgi:hypothetical protein